MAFPLLATKFYIPPSRADVIARPRLTEKLLQAAQRAACFTLLSGPAGYGKTTLLSEFARQLAQPVAWLSLDEADNDPNRFWTYLITACQSVMDGFGQAALELLRTPNALPEDTIPAILINDLFQRNEPLVLVLDDYHVIQNPTIQASFACLLDHLPHNLHLVLSTRTDPPWPLARYRARSQLVEVRAQELRFSSAETAEFLNRMLGVALSPQNAAALEERTEGWIAGLQLAALSMQGRSDIDTFVKAFTGSHIYVAEYLVDEVLERLPPEMEAFLLQTSILDRVSAGLCEAVTGCQDGQARLTALQHANIFVIPLDDLGRWFRYHHLFADLLRARLPQSLAEAEIARLHVRAADWYAQNGFESEAVHHALAARDYERVAGMIEQSARNLIFTGRLSLLGNWLAALPQSTRQNRPGLEMYQTYLDLIQGRLDVNEETMQAKEDRIRAIPSTPENDRLRLELLVLLSRFVAFINPARAIQIAQEALSEVPENSLVMRAHLFSALCIAHGMEGDAEKAAATYHESFRLAEAAGYYGQISHTTMLVAQGLYPFARLREAAGYCQAVIATGGTPDQKTFPHAGHGYVGMANILIEWNDLDTAEEYLRRGAELCRLGGLDGVFTAHALLARLRQARGDFQGALEELQYLDQTFQRKDFTVLARRILIQLAMGDASAAQWEPLLMGMLYTPRLPQMLTEGIQVILARVLLAQGALARAVPLLDALESTAGQSKRYGRMIEVHLLRARAAQITQARPVCAEALDHLERAIAYGASEGFTLLYLEEGPELIPMLQALENRVNVPGNIRQYARKLLDAFAASGAKIPAAAAAPEAQRAAGLVEPLTNREMEVLQRIAAGDSNQAIADRLVITLRTVKKHTVNIFGKLNVASRTQAVARARALGLLPPD